MTSAADRALPSGQPPPPETVVRLSGAEDILGVLPHRLGFHPTESLVVVFLDGPRQRDRLVMRVDLVDERHEGALAADVARRMRTMRTSAAVLVCYTERPSRDHRLPRAGLIRALTGLLSKRGVGVLEALLVHGGRWYSYHCTDPRCCPRSGSRLPAELTPAASRYAAEAVLRGGTVLPSREVLRLSIEPPLDASVADSAQVADGPQVTDGPQVADGAQVAEAAGRLMAAASEAGMEAWRDVVLATVDRLVAAWSDGDTEVEDDDVALVALGLHDTRSRDEVMTLPLDHEPAVLVALFSEIARRTDDVTAAPICTVLAWAAYADGSGALAAIAAERALRCEPDYEMAKLVLGGLTGLVPPSTIRRVCEEVRADLNRADAGQHD